MAKRAKRKGTKRAAQPVRRPKHVSERELLDYLLRQMLRMDEAKTLKEVAAELEMPYATLTANLRRLSERNRKKGTVPRVYSAHVVNPFETEFNHEVRIELSLDGGVIAKTDTARRKQLVRQAEAADGLRDGGPLERFIEAKIRELCETEPYNQHIIMREALILHGTSGRDVDLHVLTNDGAYSIGKYVRNVLVQDPCIRSIRTVTIGWRYSMNGYSGQRRSTQSLP